MRRMAKLAHAIIDFALGIALFVLAWLVTREFFRIGGEDE